MKLPILAFVLLFILHTTAKAQGNLQFNQVLNLSFTSNGTNFSVPVGKVWKIEEVAMSSYSAFLTMTVAGQQVFLKNTNSSYGYAFESFPYWVSGGQNIFFSGTHGGVASVIEFNVVP